MGRLLLLLLAGAVLGSIALYAGRSDLDVAGQERESQSAALARSAAEAAHAAAVGDMVDPATRRFRTALTVPAAMAFDGNRAVVKDYHLSADGRTASLTVIGYANGVAHQTTSRYQLSVADFPGPLWVDAPVVTAGVAAGAQVAGTAPDGTARPVYLDATRHAAYRLGSAISMPAMQAALSGQMQTAGAALSVQPTMAPVLAQTGTPTLTELYGAAIAAFDPARDVLRAGAHTVSGTETHGNVDDAGNPDPRIVRVRGALSVPAGATLTGNGMLLVEGNLSVAGTLRWDGLVLVVPPTQVARVDLPGTVRVRGSLMVDQEAPPPGGHTDLTVNRDLTGLWPHARGEAGSGNGGYWWALRHSHRIEAVIPDRTFYFAEPGASRHEAYTRFEQTLAAVPGQVYLRFKNPSHGGAGVVRVRLDGTDYQGSTERGFPAALARSGDPHATRTFSASSLETLVVEIRSLRMLAHLTNEEPSAIPPGTPNYLAPGRCDNRPACVGQLMERDGALALEIVRASDDRVIYTGSMYWHTKSPGHPQHTQEEAADAAWRAGVAAGTAYGTRLELGAGTTLAFSVPRIGPIAARLGLAGASVAHVGTETRHWVVGESSASSMDGTAGGVTVCAAGSTMTLTAEAARAAIRRGATAGGC